MPSAPLRPMTLLRPPATRGLARPPRSAAAHGPAPVPAAPAPAAGRPSAQAAPPEVAPAVSRLYIVEDHPVVREGYARLIGLVPDLTLVGMAASAEEAAEAFGGPAPPAADLVLVDLALPGMSGIDLLSVLHARHPALRLLVVSGHARAVYEAQALAAGAVGFVSKDDGPAVLLTAVRDALAAPTSRLAGPSPGGAEGR